MRKKPLIIAAAMAIAAAVSALWIAQGPIPVATVKPSRGAAIDAIYATGTIEPTVMLPVAPRIAGRIVALETDEGRSVKKGDVLLRLDAADLDATLDELSARARYAREQLKRTRALVERGIAAANDLDRGRADAEAADAALKRARAQRDFAVLTAPDDGEIIQRDGEVGQFIPVGQPVFFMSCCAPLRVTADVDEEDIPRVHVGQRVVLRADALPDRTFDGTVSEVTPKGDPIARSYRVRVALTEPDAFRVGMTVDANLIVTERQNALLVPSSAVRDTHVWLIDNGRLVHRAVRVGIEGLTQTEIIEGIEDDAVVVDLPDDKLREGRRARPRSAVAP